MYADPWSVFVSEGVYKRVRKWFDMREVDKLRLRASAAPVRVYQLLKLRGAPPAAGKEERLWGALGAFRMGLGYYRAREWAKAGECFMEVRRRRHFPPPPRAAS